MLGPTKDQFIALARSATADGAGVAAIALCEAIFSDQLSPALAYRRLVAPDERTAPSFLLESAPLAIMAPSPTHAPIVLMANSISPTAA
jgi:hypothetical protein